MAKMIFKTKVFYNGVSYPVGTKIEVAGKDEDELIKAGGQLLGNTTKIEASGKDEVNKDVDLDKTGLDSDIDTEDKAEDSIYNELSMEELKEECDDREVDRKGANSKKKLVELLIEADAELED